MGSKFFLAGGYLAAQCTVSWRSSSKLSLMVIDALFLIIGGWGFYQGYSKGIIKTVFTVFSVIFGLLVAFKFTPAATRFIETAFNSNSAFNFIAGFLLAFVATMIFIRLIASTFEKILQTANINVINKFAGGLLLGALYTLFYSLLLWFAEKSHIVTQETQNESFTYTYLRAFPNKMKGVYEFIKPGFQDFWRESVKFIDKMQEKSMEQTESEPTIFDIPDEEGGGGDTTKTQ